jgi:hypothetical protein
MVCGGADRFGWIDLDIKHVGVFESGAFNLITPLAVVNK